jgi:hypothetical protein
MSHCPISAPVSAKDSRCVALVTVVLFLFATTVPAQRSGSANRLSEPHSVTPTYVAAAPVSAPGPGRAGQNNSPQAATATQLLSSGQAGALSLVAADFNGDGIADLAAGYVAPDGTGMIALHYGSLDALAPQSDSSFQALARGEFPEPFLREAPVISVPAAPDLLATGNFTSGGNTDLVIAAREASVVYLLPGDGHGKFGAPQVLNLAGKITTLSAGHLGRAGFFSDLLVGVSGPQGSSLLVYRGAAKEPTLVASYRLAKPASSIALGNLTGGAGADAVVAAGGDLLILNSSTLQLEKISLPVAATAVALGSFVYDRGGRLQMAVLSPDGGLHIVVRSGMDPRPLTPVERHAAFLAAVRGLPNPVVPPANPNERWKVLENFAAVATGPSPVLLRTRISSNAADDVMVLNGSAGQMVVVSHPDLPEGAGTFVRGVVSDRPYAGSPLAAVSTPLNVNGPGIVALNQGESAPSTMMLLSSQVFTVNTTSDVVVPGACATGTPANSCSLREAVIEANADNNNDTINVPAGTYTLTLTGANKETAGNTAAYGSLDIFHALTITGAVDGSGNPATIIQAGTDNTNGIDKVFAVNPNGDPGFDTHLSNLAIKFGKNPGSFSGGGGAGSPLPHGFGGGLSWEGGQTGNMTVDNCIITDNSTVDGNGGGIAADNATGPGTLTLTNTIVQNNSAQQSSTGNSGVGGGISVTGGVGNALIAINGSQILNNRATQALNGGGQGGGIFLGNNGHSNIHGTTISGNQAAGHGGGVFTLAALQIDNAGGAMNISNNQGDQGGGLWSSASASQNLVKVTMTGNTATGSDGVNCVNSCGGGIFVGGGDIHFSRLAGNTAASGSNLATVGPFDATNATGNWWGANSPAGTIYDPNAAVIFDPVIILANTPNPASISANQSSTLTGDMSSDSFGNSLSGNLDVLIGLPITFHNAVLGTIAEAQPEALSSGAQATATYTAGSAGGKGSVDATVDQQTVTAKISVTGPLATPPTISKLFLPDTIVENHVSVVSFTITNPNSDVTLTGIQFTDALPAGLQVANDPTLVSNDCGGTLTANPGSASISLTGGTIAPAVPLLPPPFLHRESGASRPASLFPSRLPSLLPSRRASLSPFSATGACFISVPVTAPGAGVFTNTTGVISANESGPGATSNTATLTVTAAPIVVPPTVAKAFGDVAISLNGTTSLTFTITNPNVTASLVNIGVTDLLPSGLVVANPNGLAGSCILSEGTVIANPGTGSISLAAVSLPGSSSGANACSFTVNVTGVTSGVKNNVTGNISGSFDDGSDTFVGITGGTASATLVVALPPSIVKVFSPTVIAPTGVSTVSFVISNPSANPIALTGVGFTDALPANLFVANPSGASGNCNGGTLTAVAGSSTISLTGGTIPVNGSCTVSANVTSAVIGIYVNTTTATSANAGSGNTATATLRVAPPDLSITKTHKCDFARRQKGATYTITVSDSASAGPTLGTVSVTDTLPDVEHTLVPTDISGTGWTCNLATLTCTRSDSLAPGASYPPITLTVDVPQNIRANVVNSATVSGGGDPNSHTANDPTHIGPPVNGNHSVFGVGRGRNHDECDVRNVVHWTVRGWRR